MCGGGGTVVMVVVDVHTRMMGEGKVDGEHANKFEGGLIALRSDSLQIYTGGVYVFKGGELYMCGGGLWWWWWWCHPKKRQKK